MSGKDFSFKFAFKGELPLFDDLEGTAKFKEEACAALKDYYNDLSPVASDLMDGGRVVMGAKFPTSKQAEIQEQFPDQQIIVMDASNPERNDLLDFHDGAIYIPDLGW